MHVKEITRPNVRDIFFYGKIISWKFNDSIVYLKKVMTLSGDLIPLSLLIC